MSPSITYSLTTCNEFIEVQRLVQFLLQHKRPQDNIVILYDEANGDPEVENFLRTHSINGEFTWHKGQFNRDFASWKNKLIDLCDKDFICNLDADELPHENLMKSLPAVLELNPSIDAYWVPRINTLSGDENEVDQYVNQMGWNVSTLPNMTTEVILDLDDPKDLKRYNSLKSNGLIITEDKI